MHPYLRDGISSHGPDNRDRTEEEQDMFTIDSFLSAEITYRQEKIRKDYGVRRWARARADQTQK